MNRSFILKELLFCLNIALLIYLAVLCLSCNMGIYSCSMGSSFLIRDQTQHWEGRVLATGPPGKSLC